jgi:hypothetical protein
MPQSWYRPQRGINVIGRIPNTAIQEVWNRVGRAVTPLKQTQQHYVEAKGAAKAQWDLKAAKERQGQEQVQERRRQERHDHWRAHTSPLGGCCKDRVWRGW